MSPFIPDVAHQAEEIRKRTALLRSLNSSDFAREAELGPMNFKDAVVVLDRAKSTLLRGAEVDLEAVPANHLRELNSRMDRLLRRYDSIKTFDPKHQSPRDRDSLIQAWSNEYQEEYHAAAQCLAATPIKVPDFTTHEKAAEERLQRLAELEKRASQQLEAFEAKAKTEIDAILSAARSASAGTGIAQHATSFEAQANRHRVASWRWLAASAALAGSTALFGFWMADHYTIGSGELSAGRSVQLAVARLFIFSVLYLAAVWCGRNYKAHKHNEVVNRHRQHALRTFEAFNAGTTDPGTKNAVLLQTTAAIFGHSQSGFSTNEADAGGTPQIIELIRNVGPHKSDP